MKNIDCEIYISQMITFFENNPGDFMDLVGDVQKEDFYKKIREQSLKNLEEGNDFVLTKQQIIDIVVELKVPELNDRLKIEKHIFKTKFGDIILN
jgi:hypothetical protein